MIAKASRQPAMIPLKGVCLLMSSGGTPSRKHPDYFTADATGNLWVKSKELLDGPIYSTEERITGEAIENSSAKYYPENTVLLAMYGANVGQLGILRRRATVNQAICGMVVNPSVADFRYVFYAIMHRRRALVAKAFGAAQQNLNQELISSFEIPPPPLPIQRKIAAVLSAYDDLIEVNTRRIKILEEMAQALYREWFVHFRFPGHEGTEMVDSALGKIPKGWEVVTTRDVSSYINRGVSPKYDDQSQSVVVNQKCIRDGRLNLGLVRRHATRVPREKLVRFGDVLVNSTGIGTLGRVAQVYQEVPDCTVDSHVSIVRPSDRVSIDYFGFFLEGLQPYFDSQGIGSTGQTELGRETIAKAGFLLPPKGLQESFAEIVSPMRGNTIKMSVMNANLRRTRHLLLPKLIAGEVDVSDLEIAMPDA